ncbi:aromatase/cyclase [Streptomyces sp. NPDC006482]|uniref:aromatase/cyclase n=1 Tax=unclassified Streptomyces TaxID=2593676 RepID=UPI00225ADBEF|nr:aromatase/cyclase [Streptomyces sp. NBC_00094]MCX5393908.1 aromatase/cyclase [Streptomyces sp. NBC_00094]
MTQHTTRETAHEITVHATADRLYALVADVGGWPAIFPPSVHADHLERGDTEERIRLWATVDGQVRHWTSRRTLDRAGLRVGFRQEVPSPPIAAMGGAWIIEPTGPEECRVRLLHDFRAAGDDAGTLDWIDRAVDANSRAELAALKAHAERPGGENDTFLTFEDTVRLEGHVKDVYDFIDQAQHWADRLPHVTAVSLRDAGPGVQILAMDTLTKDGSPHTTESVRVCVPYERIVYKQTTLPPLMALHTGTWLFEEDGTGATVVTSRHTAVVEPRAVTRVLGETADVPAARRFLREALGANSLATLRHAGAYAAARR